MKDGIARGGRRAGNADEESAVLAKIAALPQPGRAMAERLHAIIKANGPGLAPRSRRSGLLRETTHDDLRCPM